MQKCTEQTALHAECDSCNLFTFLDKYTVDNDQCANHLQPFLFNKFPDGIWILVTTTQTSFLDALQLLFNVFSYVNDSSTSSWSRLLPSLASLPGICFFISQCAAMHGVSQNDLLQRLRCCMLFFFFQFSDRGISDLRCQCLKSGQRIFSLYQIVLRQCLSQVWIDVWMLKTFITEKFMQTFHTGQDNGMFTALEAELPLHCQCETYLAWDI